MRVSILLQITAGDGTTGSAEEVVAFEKATERAEDVGLSLADGKALLAAVQRQVVQAQAEEWAGRHRCCASCSARRRSNGSYPVLFRTLYGDVQLASPRLHRCACRDGQGPATLSLLHDLIPGHVAPERLYLEARWASLVPYAAAADLLTDVLPIASGANATTLRQHVLRVAERAESELGKEQSSFIDGCPAQWAELPIPEGRIVVGLDGSYVRDGYGVGDDMDDLMVKYGQWGEPPARRCLWDTLGTSSTDQLGGGPWLKVRHCPAMR